MDLEKNVIGDSLITMLVELLIFLLHVVGHIEQKWSKT